MAKSETIVINKFVLGKGKDGMYSNLELLVKKGGVAGLQIGSDVESKNMIVLGQIEELLKEWIQNYGERGILLKIIVLNVGVDEEGREYAVDNSVNGAMHKALPEIGILPPQIFEL